MKKTLLLSIFLTCSYSACYSEESVSHPKELAQVGIGVEVDEGGDYDDDDDDEQVIWVGPGLYYGIWFDNEWDYNDWYGHHYHDHGHGHDHGGGDHHHGGGGHGGGGHH